MRWLGHKKADAVSVCDPPPTGDVILTVDTSDARKGVWEKVKDRVIDAARSLVAIGAVDPDTRTIKLNAGTAGFGTTQLPGGQLADGAITNAKVSSVPGDAIAGSKLSAGTGPLSHLSSAGVFDSLTNVTSRNYDDLQEGSVYKRVAAAAVGSGADLGKLNLGAGSSGLVGKLAGANLSNNLALEGTLSVAQSIAITPASSDGMPYSMILDQATTNLVPNPSFELNANGWSAYSAGTIARDTTTFEYGVACLKVSVADSANSNGTITDLITGIDDGTSYTFSAYVSCSLGSKNVVMAIEWYDSSDTLLSTNSLTIAPDTAFGRFWVSAAAPANATKAKLRVNNDGTDQNAYDIFIDAVQLENKSNRTSYCDGSMGAGYSWSGTAHASSSSRTGGMHFVGGFATTHQPVLMRDSSELFVEGYVIVGTEKGRIRFNPAFQSGGVNTISSEAPFGSGANADLMLLAGGTAAVRLGRSIASAMRITGAGTSFPASPLTTNDIFFRTDRGILYFYDGTRWLSMQQFNLWMAPYSGLPGTAVTATTSFRDISTAPDAPGSGQIYIEKFVSNWQVAGTNTSPSHQWNIGISDSPSTNFLSFNTGGLGSNVWVRTIYSAGGPWLRTVGTDLHYRLNLTKTGSPGNLFVTSSVMHYRLVG